MVDGCVTVGTGVPVDAAARSVLTSTELPSRVDLRALDAPGTPLNRWILAVLALLIIAELALTGRTGARRPLATSRG